MADEERQYEERRVAELAAEEDAAQANERRAEVFGEISAELDRAYAKHGRRPWGRHEFYGILKEEFRELEDAIFDDEPMGNVLKELTQVAAMCVRYYEQPEGDAYGYGR